MAACPKPAIVQHATCRIVPRSTRDSATGVGTRPAEVQALQRHPVIRCTDHGARTEQLVETHLSMKNVTPDEAETPLQVQWRMDLATEDRLGETRSMGIYGRDDRVRCLVALVVPASARPKIITEMLAEERGDMLALRSETWIERRRDEHLDDWLLRPSIHRGIEPSLVHIVEIRRHDDARGQVIALLRQHRKLRQLGKSH